MAPISSRPSGLSDLSCLSTETAADFTGVTESTKEADRIHISQIEHKAYIDVNEAGTEAAAATAIEFALKSRPPDKKIVKIDHPFIYLIMEKASRAILFIGRVSDPRM